jgi:molybdopterin-guanine dinucleotide biosynthesis protein A
MTEYSHTAPAPVTGVVLAGGHSTRFGPENKALADFDGETVLERVLEVVDACTDRPPILAVRSAEQRAELESVVGERSVHFAVDREGFEGPVAGLAGAIDGVASPWLLVSACDMPLVSRDALDWLAAQRGPDLDAVAPTEDGQYHPLLTCYRRSAVADALPKLPGAAGPRVLLEWLDRVRDVPVESTPAGVDLERSLISVDTKRGLATVAPRQ